MNKSFIFPMVILCFMITLSKNAESLETQNDNSYGSNIHHKKIIELEVDIEEQRKLQAEVDSGHQPWRLEPVEVAFAGLSNLDKNIYYENCYLITKMNNEAKVKCKGAKHYIIYLKRMVRPNGIWTAISIEIE